MWPPAKEDTPKLASVGSLSGTHSRIQVWLVEGGMRRLSDCRRLRGASWESPQLKEMSLDSHNVKDQGQGQSQGQKGESFCTFIQSLSLWPHIWLPEVE